MLSVLIALFVLSVPQSAPPRPSANVWHERAAEFEDYLRTAAVARVVDLTVGVTKPRRAFTQVGGLAESFAWKPLKPGRYLGYWESYKSEIAAYEIDKLLGLNMVPPTVERRVKGEVGAAVLWLQNVRSWDAVQPLEKPAAWNQELARMKMFDDLIGNSDRNKGNLLIDDEWALYLIDHSRAFVTDSKLPFEIDRVDRRVWERMRALDEPGLAAQVGKWLDRAQIRAMLRRRAKMQETVDALTAKYGDRIFF